MRKFPHFDRMSGCSKKRREIQRERRKCRRKWGRKCKRMRKRKEKKEKKNEGSKTCWRRMEDAVARCYSFERESVLLLSRFVADPTVGFLRDKKDSCSSRRGQRVGTGFGEFRQTP